MCALTISPPSSPDARNDSSWVCRVKKRYDRQATDVRAISLGFRDLEVSVRDVTTVGETLLRCSPADLLDAVMRHEVGWRVSADAMGSRARHVLAGKVGTALEAMRSLEDAAVALSPSQEGVIGPSFRFVRLDDGSGLEHKVEAVVLSRDDAALIAECLECGLERVDTWDDLRALRCDADARSVPDRLSPDALRASPTLLSRIPWERTLALPLWLPEGLSEEEYWAILAKIFWSMTYHGFTLQEVHRKTSLAQVTIESCRSGRSVSDRWPDDPVLAVLDHNCWIDTLQAWNAFFALPAFGEAHP